MLNRAPASPTAYTRLYFFLPLPRASGLCFIDYVVDYGEIKPTAMLNNFTDFKEVIDDEESFCEMTLSKTFDAPITDKEKNDVVKAASQMAFHFMDTLVSKNPEANGQVGVISGSFEDNERTIILSLKLINGLMSKEIIRKAIIAMPEQ